MKIDEIIPIEPGFQDGIPVYWWRVEWDEEQFCYVKARTEKEARDKGMTMMSRGTNLLLPPFVSVVSGR